MDAQHISPWLRVSIGMTTVLVRDTPALWRSQRAGRGLLEPGTQLALGCDGGSRHVVLVFSKTSHWAGCWLEPRLDHPLMRRIQGEGHLLSLQQHFPPTSGRRCERPSIRGCRWVRMGVFEWHLYEPRSTLIVPLPFSFAANNMQESLVGNLSPDVLLPFETVYERLGRRGERTAALADSAIIPSSDYADRNTPALS